MSISMLIDIFIFYAGSAVLFVGTVALMGVFFYVVIYRLIMKGHKQLKFTQIFCWVLFIGYMYIVVGATLLFRGASNYTITNLSLFSTHILAINGNANELRNIILNIAMFIPIGMFIHILLKKSQNYLTSISVVMILSLAIETAQLITRRGIFSLDDILNNTLGGLLGIVAIKVISKFFKHIGKATYRAS